AQAYALISVPTAISTILGFFQAMGSSSASPSKIVTGLDGCQSRVVCGSWIVLAKSAARQHLDRPPGQPRGGALQDAGGFAAEPAQPVELGPVGRRRDAAMGRHHPEHPPVVEDGDRDA